MKRGSEYAKRIKRLFQQLARKYGKPAAAELTDPTEQLIVGILSSCASNTRAHAVFRKLRQEMVDLNELRVTPPMELAGLIADHLPMAEAKAQNIVEALNDVRRRQDTLDLDFLKNRTRREAREYLESLEGVDRSAAASVVLYSLGGHAIPVDELTLYILRKEELVDPSAEVDEVQGFLERHVSAADGRAFCDLLSRYVAARSARVPIEQLGELLAGPSEPEPPPEPEPAPPPAKKAARKKTAAARKKTAASATAKSRKAAASKGTAVGRRKKK